MKRLQDQSSAQQHHKQICASANRIERELLDLVSQVDEIQRFYRQLHRDFKDSQNQSTIRSAENELIRLNRKISSLQVVLKHLSNVRFPEVKSENFSNQQFNKIDKNVRTSILELRPEDGAE
jgi:hypothetical protein